MKGSVMHIGRITIPTDHLTEVVEQETQLATDDPAAVGKPFLANLLLRTTFPNGVDQLNSIAIDHTQQPGFSQKDVRPDLMGREQAKQSGAFGQFGKQGQIIPCQPTIESTIAHSFQRKQDAPA